MLASAKVDVYNSHFEELKVTATVAGTWRETDCTVRMSNQRGSFTQQLTPPHGLYFVSRSDWDAHNLSRPAVGMIWQEASPYIWCLTTALLGVTEESTILVFRWSGNDWQPLSGPSPTFSNRGTFYIQDDRLYAVDTVYDERFARWDDQRFALREYSLSSTAIKLVSKRVTSKRYSPEGTHGYPVPDIVEASNDPLVEFGLKWRWWGDRLITP